MRWTKEEIIQGMIFFIFQSWWQKHHSAGTWVLSQTSDLLLYIMEANSGASKAARLYLLDYLSVSVTAGQTASRRCFLIAG